MKTQPDHVEAFCLMQYECTKCKEIEILWNSRDGVTPFGIGSSCCPGSISNHVNWGKDLRVELELITKPGSLLLKPSRVFINMTKERAIEISDKFWHEHGKKLLSEHRHLRQTGEKKLRSNKVEAIFSNGKAPDLVSFKVYLKHQTEEG